MVKLEPRVVQRCFRISTRMISRSLLNWWSSNPFNMWKKNIYKEIFPFTIPMWHVFNGAIIQCHSHLRGQLYIDLKLDCLEPVPLAVGYSRGLAVSLLELPLSCIWRLTIERYPQSNRATEMAVAPYAFPSSNSDSKQLIFIKFPNCCRGKTDSSRLISPLM